MTSITLALVTRRLPSSEQSSAVGFHIMCNDFSSMIDCELPDQRKGTNPKKKLFATKGEKNVVHVTRRAVVAQPKSEPVGQGEVK